MLSGRFLAMFQSFFKNKVDPRDVPVGEDSVGIRFTVHSDIFQPVTSCSKGKKIQIFKLMFLK